MSDKKIKLNSGESLKTFLSQVFEEGVKSTLAQKALTEKEKQDAISSPPGADEPLFDSGSDSGDKEKDVDTSSKTMDDEKEKLSKGDVEPGDIIDKLNSIRSGKSFKDDRISKAMDEYINSLSKAEKVALLAFTKGIAQIVTGEVSGQSAEEPSDSAPNVKMQKGEKKDVKHVQPNVIKAPGGVKQKHSVEDTSAPVPITPKKR